MDVAAGFGTLADRPTVRTVYSPQDASFKLAWLPRQRRKTMLRITQNQMDLLDAACFRRNAIGFVAGELLRLFDDDAAPANVAESFDQLSLLFDMKTRHGRLTVVLLLLGTGAFGETFTQPAIVRLMAVPCTPERRQELVHDALLKHRYDADFVRRQAWV